MAQQGAAKKEDTWERGEEVCSRETGRKREGVRERDGRRARRSRGSVIWVYLVTLAMVPGPTSAKSKVYVISRADQIQRINEERLACFHRKVFEPYSGNDAHCETVFDKLMCWPAVAAGTVVIQPCPYLNGFLINGTASRECTANGTWFSNTQPNSSNGWTNYSQCHESSAEQSQLQLQLPLTDSQMGRLRIVYNIGYGVSLASLTVALATMLYFKKLHCPRNTIHVNLFVSLALRAVISFLKETLFVHGWAFAKDVDNDDKDGSQWQCKLFTVLFNYIMSASYMWIFVEGLYLHMLIFVSVFSERSSICWYIILGWLGPMTFVIPWAVIRATVENIMCWIINEKRAYFWILNGPVVATVIVNFIFFVRIVWVLFTKLQASNIPDGRRYRYVKLAKSTLVLIPLFGVPYMLFFWVDPSNANRHLEAVKIYFEMIFNSFVGFLIAVLFCFLNGEVQGEVRKKWQRFQLSRGALRSSNRSVSNTMVTDVTRGRSSLPSIHSVHDRVDNVVVVNGTTPKPLLLLQDPALDEKDKEEGETLVFTNDHSDSQHTTGKHPEREFLINEEDEDENRLVTRTDRVTPTIIIDEGVVMSEGESNL